MALKITTQIGTDKGITSEAYVRISNYQISKYGNASFSIEIYQTEGDVPTVTGSLPMIGSGIARNQQIGDNLWILLTKEVGDPVTNVPDLSPLEETTIFTYGYAQLKAKLVGLFGAENVVDC